MFRSPISVLVVTALLAGAPATAQDYQARNVGDWTVSSSNDGNGCFVTRQYDGTGKTTLMLGVDTDGSNHLSVLNDNWSIKPGDHLQLTFRLSNGGYAKHEVIGIASDGQRGFVTTFEAKFPTYFAASKVLSITRGDVPVEYLDLTGSGAAVTELQKCVDSYRNKPAPKSDKNRRSGSIPKDPFASDTAQPSKKQRSSQ